MVREATIEVGGVLGGAPSGAASAAIKGHSGAFYVPCPGQELVRLALFIAKQLNLRGIPSYSYSIVVPHVCTFWWLQGKRASLWTHMEGRVDAAET